MGQTIQQMWGAGAERRAFVSELLCQYEKRWDGILRRELRRRFLDEVNFQNLALVGDTSINVLRWAVDKVAAIYSRAPSRSIAGEPLPPQYENGGELDLSLDKAAKLCFLCRELFLRPVFLQRGAKFVLSLDLLTPDQVEVCWNSSDPLRIDSILFQRSDGFFEFWDKDKNEVFDPYWNMVSSEKNPYGIIPIVPIHAEYPTRQFWHHEEIDPLVRANVETAIGMTQLRYLNKMQSFKQLCIKGQIDEKSARFVADPGRALLVPHGEVEILDWTGPLAESLEVILNQAAFALARFGIRPDVIRGTTDASSGYALEIKMHELERIWESQRMIWTVWERLLADTVSRMIPPSAGWSLPPGLLEISYAQIGPARDPKEQADLAIALQSAGWSTANTMREVFRKSEEWITANVLEKRIENPILPTVNLDGFGGGT